jgi:hypothetical protein
MAVGDGTTGKGILFGVLAGVAVGLLGFSIATVPRMAGMGVALFYVVPVAAGFAIGIVTRGQKSAAAAGILATVITIGSLIAGGREGWICALLVLPIICLPLFIGLGLGMLFRRHILKDQVSCGTPALLLLPVLIAGAHWAERPMLDQVRTETVTTTVHVPADPATTWTMIESIDQVRGPKPWMMRVGLPVPVRCTLERQAAGAKRVCYFEDGTIEEQVTEWTPPNRMRLHITHTHMGIHHWMGFQDAVYELAPEGDGTRLSRTTTLESSLYPAWYWRGWERMGVEQEHQYLLNDVVLRAQKQR